MGKVKRPFWTSKLCAQRVVCPCPEAIYMYKIMKNVYKIDFKQTFLNLQQMGKVKRPFCWHQNFVPKGLSAPSLGLYTCINSLKMCIKSDFMEILYTFCTNGLSDKAFRLRSKFCLQGVVCPCPWAIYYMYRII